MTQVNRGSSEFGTVIATGVTVVGTAQQIIKAVPARSYWRIINLSSGTLWLTKSGQTPVAGAAWCYPLLTNGMEEFARPNYVPTNGCWAISDGTTIQVNIELSDG